MKLRFKQFISSHKSLAESFFSLSVLNLIESLLPLITMPYILRVVGAANYGVYSYILIIIQYLQIFNAYGFNFSATKQISQNREDTTIINRTYSSVLTCRLLLFIGGAMIVLTLSPFLMDNKEQLLMYCMGLGIVFGDSLNPIWLFQGKEKMRYMTIVNASTKIFFTLLIFIFIRKAEDYVYLILYQSLGYIISGILSTIIAIRIFKVHFSIPSWNDIAFQFKDGFAVFSSTIGINLYRNANIFILKFFVSDAALGVYSAAEKIIKGIQMLTNPIAQALFPHMSLVFKQHTLDENLKTLRKSALVLSAILGIAMVMTLLFAEWIVTLLCGSEYLEAVRLVRIMAPIIVIAGLNYILGIVGLINLNYPRAFLYSVFIAGILSIIGLSVFAPKYGIIAGALAMLGAECVLLICILFSLIRLMRKNIILH